MYKAMFKDYRTYKRVARCFFAQGESKPQLYYFEKPKKNGK